MGEAILKFKPRDSLSEFINTKGKVSLLRRTGGKKSSSNMSIYGENLTSLAALAAGSGTSKRKFLVDIIYIDPPYNVGGNQGYKNVWKGKSEKERDWAGDHGAFLDFMEPRLKIGRQLLSEDGVIFVSICDGEYARLKILMNQIFGESNEIATFIWNKGRAAGGSHASAMHEYVLCYARNKKKTPQFRQKKQFAHQMIKKSEELLESNTIEIAQKMFKKWVSEEKKKGNLRPGEAAYSQIHPVNKRLFHADNSCAQDDPKGRRCRKVLKHPITNKPCPVPKNGWKWKEETLDKLVSEGLIWFGENHSVVPKIIKYLDEKTDQLPLTIINDGSDGKKDFPEEIVFTTPKPVSFIKTLLSFVPKKDGIVLDYFAGSGATAHAVHALNEEDKGNRSWVMIEEMGSTFHDVLIPRINFFDKKQNYSTFELKTASTGDKSLVKMFNNYSSDFLSAFHQVSDEASILVEGLNVIGLEQRSEKIVAMTVPTLRKSEDSFIEELATFKDAIKKTKAKSAVIYTIKGDDYEEPWVGLDKSLLAGTSCKSFDVIEIPDQLVEEWNDVLSHMAA